MLGSRLVTEYSRTTLARLFLDIGDCSFLLSELASFGPKFAIERRLSKHTAHGIIGPSATNLTSKLKPPFFRSLRRVQQGSQNAQNFGGVAEITADSFDVPCFEGIFDLSESAVPLLDARIFRFRRMTRLDPRQ